MSQANYFKGSILGKIELCSILMAVDLLGGGAWLAEVGL